MLDRDPTAYIDIAQIDRNLAELSDIAVHGSPLRSKEAWEDIDALLDFRNFVLKAAGIAITMEIHE